MACRCRSNGLSEPRPEAVSLQLDQYVGTLRAGSPAWDGCIGNAFGGRLALEAGGAC
jgi:hypothetical protein